MNTEEAKFILSAYRSGGRDAADPAFAEALAQVERDPDLRAWWERERGLDAAVAARLRLVAPPAGLREAILAGGRVSGPARPTWRRPPWLAAAAAVVVLIAATVAWRSLRAPPTWAELAAQSIQDLVASHHAHVGGPRGGRSWQDRLAGVALPLPQTLALDLSELRQRRCRTLKVGGREVFEFCFERDGAWFHLYAARRADFSPGGTEEPVQLTGRDGYVAATWADAANVYTLVTGAGYEALRRLI